MKKSYIKFPYLSKDIVVYERDNGHRVVFAHKDGAMANISTWVRTGSINENDKINGISHFLEHLMFKGTHAHKAGYFDRTLEAKGAIVNAATWKDYTFYYVTLPKGIDDKDLYLAIELHCDMMTDPVIPDEEIGFPFDLDDTNIKEKRERHVVIEEIRMRKDQPWTKVYNNCNFNMYSSHPYKRDVIGTAQIISQVTRDEVMDYYKTFYTPNNMVTIVVGDFDEEKVLELIEKHFDFGDRKNCELPIHKLDSPTQKTIIVEEKSQVNSGYLMLGWICDKASSMKNSAMMSMLSIILGDGTSSRLYQHLVENNKDRIFTYADSEHYQFKDGDNFFVQANFKPEQKEEAIRLVKLELEKFLTDEITDEEFLKAQKKVKTGQAATAETVSDIADMIGTYFTVLGDLNLMETTVDVINSITKDDLKECAKKYLNIDNAVISILMPES